MADIFSKYILPFGGMLVFLGVIVVAVKLIMNAHNPKERVATLKSIFSVAVGAIIIGGTLMITGLIIGASNDILGPTHVVPGTNATTAIDNTKETGDVVSKLLAAFTDGIRNGVAYIMGKAFSDYKVDSSNTVSMSDVIFQNILSGSLAPTLIIYTCLCCL